MRKENFLKLVKTKICESNTSDTCWRGCHRGIQPQSDELPFDRTPRRKQGKMQLRTQYTAYLCLALFKRINNYK